MTIRCLVSALVTCLSAALLLPAAWAEDFSLTVINGSGSGEYPAGARVFISANPYDNADPARATWEHVDDAGATAGSFSSWLVAGSLLDDDRSSETWVTMPSRDSFVIATYEPAERWAPPVVWQQIPPAPVGLIFMFHGGRGSTATIAAKTESGVFAQQALVRGYGVVFVESFNRKDGEFNWEKDPDPAENYDLQRVAALRSRLIENQYIDNQTPVFLWGVSGGGQFASLFVETTQQALDFPVAGQVLIVSAGEPAIMRQTHTPTLFLIGDNDNGVRGPAQRTYEDLLTRGIPTRLRVNMEIPVHPERFWRIQGLNRTDSVIIYTALRSGGILNADNFLVDRPKNLNWEQFVPPDYYPFIKSIEDQLYIVYGGHRLMSNLNHEIFDFFANHLP